MHRMRRVFKALGAGVLGFSLALTSLSDAQVVTNEASMLTGNTPNTSGNWQIHDVRMEGVSMVVMHRATFAHEIKTKGFVNILGALELSGKKCLVLDEGKNVNVQKSCANIMEVKYTQAAVASTMIVRAAEVTAPRPRAARCTPRRPDQSLRSTAEAATSA